MPKAAPPTVTLIVTNLPIVADPASDTGSLFPQLALLAGRGTVRRFFDAGAAVGSNLRPWQYGLLQALGLGRSADRYPGAVMTGMAESLEPAGCWMHLEPVHLAAGLDHLRLEPLFGAARASAEDLAALRPVIEQHLQACGFGLHATQDGQWLIHTDRALQADSTCPDVAAQRELQQEMPRGRDAGEIRRLMTELQMLLHDHPANERRARRGLPAINALWIWCVAAAGRTTPQDTSANLPRAFGDEAYLRGLYRLYGQTCEPPLRDGDELRLRVSAQSNVIVVTEVADPAALESAWLAPLTRELAAGRLGRLDVMFDGWLVSTPRGALRRFWRRALPPQKWVA